MQAIYIFANLPLQAIGWMMSLQVATTVKIEEFDNGMAPILKCQERLERSSMQLFYEESFTSTDCKTYIQFWHIIFASYFYLKISIYLLI